MAKKVRIGTRGSKLALWQAHYTRDLLEKHGAQVEIKVIKTQGDRIQHLGFDKMEGKGFFTKEIEAALLGGAIDLAVHSMKDLPTDHPEGLVVAGLSERANPADCLVIRAGLEPSDRLWGLPENPRIGTSSARRKAQLRDLLGEVQLEDIRGNVPTRLKKLETQDLHATMLASAGLERLGLDLSAYRVIHLHPREFVPAPAQGVLAWQVRASDRSMRRLILSLHQKETARCTNVERGVLKLMGGGCHMPLGVYCERDRQGHYHVWAAMADTWDGPLCSVQQSSSTHAGLAERVVEALKAAAV